MDHQFNPNQIIPDFNNYSNDPRLIHAQFQQHIMAGYPPTLVPIPSNIPLYPGGTVSTNSTKSKYSQLLAVIQEMGRDIRPIYAGSKTAIERLKRGINQSKILIKECSMESERS